MSQFSRHQKAHLHRRGAMTVIELLIVLAVIGIIVSLVMPSLMSARESARKTACLSNLRQLALGISSFSSAFRMYPTNGGYYAGECLVRTPYDAMETIGTDDFFLVSSNKWGVGNSTKSPLLQTGSWCYSILPQLEEQTAYLESSFQKHQPIFLCSSRQRGRPTVAQSDEFGNYFSAGWAWAKTDYAGNALLLVSRRFSRTERFRPIDERSGTDGLSNTILIGEKAFSTRVNRPSSWYWDEPIFSGGNHGTVRLGVHITDDTNDKDFRHNWGSAHRECAHFAMADGTTRTISKSILPEEMRRLITPADSDSQLEP